TPGDVAYNPLPLYHATGGVLGPGIALMGGAALHISRKFSASRFWDDVAESDATVFMYIGELCRYLMNSPEHPKERSHRVRAGVGNGLRKDVWSGFVERFQVSSMREFYSSTEGNVAFVNMDGTIGAVGQLPRFMDGTMGVAFVKFDVEAEAPIRNKDGFCIKCDANEVGEVLGEIKGTGRSSFEGYEDKAATEKKILSDVFKKGDKWFRTGDLMSRDEYGYVQFVDRIGDTFRWKGENVATNEVADVISKFDGVELANVYGVEVPHTDGRAGMAALTVNGTLDYSELAQHLLESLPTYAVPLFLRENREADTTGTFKFRKVDAVREGFDPTRIQDPIWILDAKLGTYTPLTDAKHKSILCGEVRF
ncbi:MAG: AMP-binding protein, partial [Pseudomonadota bacterium]